MRMISYVWLRVCLQRGEGDVSTVDANVFSVFNVCCCCCGWFSFMS